MSEGKGFGLREYEIGCLVITRVGMRSVDLEILLEPRHDGRRIFSIQLKKEYGEKDYTEKMAPSIHFLCFYEYLIRSRFVLE